MTNSSRILVYGDIILDRYITGEVSRISPEAPVPVVRVTKEFEQLGGAANVARNLATMGADVTLCGLLGDDIAGVQLREICEASGIMLRPVITQQPTIVKTRVLAGQHQIVRYDHEAPPSTTDIDSEVCAALSSLTEGHETVIVSDYAKGAVTEAGLEICKSQCYTVVDPKPTNISWYQGVDVITPNKREFEEIHKLLAAGIDKPSSDDIERQLDLVYTVLRLREGVLHTRGADGMMYQGAAGVASVKAEAKSVFDVTGAGDSVAASFTYSRALGVDPLTAMRIANRVGSYVVGELGAAVCPADLFNKIMQEETGR